jgi:hypothetical protein
MKQEPKTHAEILDLLEGYATSKGAPSTIARDFFGEEAVRVVPGLASLCEVRQCGELYALGVREGLSREAREWLIADALAQFVGADATVSAAFADAMTSPSWRPAIAA